MIIMTLHNITLCNPELLRKSAKYSENNVVKKSHNVHQLNVLNEV